MFQGFIPRRGKFVDPIRIEDPCSKRTGDLGVSVVAAGMDKDDFIEHPTDRFETGGKVCFPAPHNHGEANSGPLAKIYRRAIFNRRGPYAKPPRTMKDRIGSDLNRVHVMAWPNLEQIVLIGAFCVLA